jgi:hypothetical protein
VLPFGGSASNSLDPVAVVDSLEAMWNTQDIDGLLSYFSDDAVVTVEDSRLGQHGRYEGKEQIKRFARRHVPGRFLYSRSHHSTGDQLIWMSAVFSDQSCRQKDPIMVRSEAVIHRGKIVTLTMAPAPGNREQSRLVTEYSRRRSDQSASFL